MVKLKDLDWVCKIGIIGGWAVLIIWLLAFIFEYFKSI